MLLLLFLSQSSILVNAYPDVVYNPWQVEIFRNQHNIVNCIPLYRPCTVSNKTGKHLSPIDIDEESTKFIEFPLLSFSNTHWLKKNFFLLNNTGHLAEYTQTPPMKAMTLTGGPLRSIYKLDNVHAHWNPLSDFQGSEHTFNKHRYAMEFHAVYFNKKYGNIEKAKGKTDGLAVCAFMVESFPDIHYNFEFDPLSLAAEQVREPYTIAFLRYNIFHAFKYLATSEKYFHYRGTVTGDSTEPVSWIIFKDTIHIHPDQVEPFRRMLNPQGRSIFNIRAAEPKNGRTVYFIDNSN